MFFDNIEFGLSAISQYKHNGLQMYTWKNIGKNEVCFEVFVLKI